MTMKTMFIFTAFFIILLVIALLPRDGEWRLQREARRCQETLEALRESSITHGDHALDLRGIDHRHDSRKDRHIDVRDLTFFVELEELIIIEKELGDQHFRTGIHLRFQSADLADASRRFRMALRVACA